jgi:hypothetical protein
MEPVSHDILTQFNSILSQKKIPDGLQEDYRKWLRYFLDYRIKYSPPDQRSEQVRLFIEKLRSKGASGRSLHDAAHALSLYFSLQPKMPAAVVHAASARMACPVAEPGPPVPEAAQPMPSATAAGPAKRGGRRYNEWWSIEKTRSPEWDDIVIGGLVGEIKARHYLSSKMKRLRASILRVYSFSYPLAPLTPEFPQNAESLCRLVPKIPNVPEGQATPGPVA